MSYRNPQRIINRETDAILNGGRDMVNIIARTTSDIRASVKAQKEEKQRLLDIQDAEQQSMYSKMNEVSSSGSGCLDGKIKSFWNDKVDQVAKIKNQMQTGEWDEFVPNRQAGNQMIANIDGLVDKFGKQAGAFAQQSSAFRDAKTNGNLSSTGSIQNKQVLEAIGNNDCLDIVEKEGNIYYYKPGQTDDDGNELTIDAMIEGGKGALVNGNEMVSQIAGGQDMFETMYNPGEGLTSIYNNTADPESGDSEFVETVKLRKGDEYPKGSGIFFNNIPEGKEYTYSSFKEQDEEGGDNKSKILDQMSSSKGMDVIVGNPKMNTVWQDEIPDGELVADENGVQPGGQGYIETFTPNSIAYYAKQLNIPPQFQPDGNNYDFLQNSAWKEFATDMDPEEQAEITDYQDKIARLYLAQKSFDENAKNYGTAQLIQKNNVIPPPVTNADKNKNTPYQFGKAAGDQINTRQADYDRVHIDTIKLFEGGKSDTNAINDYIMGELDGFVMGTEIEGADPNALYTEDNVKVNPSRINTPEKLEEFILLNQDMNREALGYFRKNQKPEDKTATTSSNNPAGLNIKP